MGFLSLYELNINRSSDFIYPYVINGGPGVGQTFRQKIGNSLVGKRTLFDPNAGICNNPYTGVDFGADQSGSYPMSASIVRRLTTATNTLSVYVYDSDQTSPCVLTNVQHGYYDSSNTLLASVNKYISSLQNVARKYTTLSPHFEFSGSLKKKQQEGGGTDPALWTQNAANGTQILGRNLLISDVNMIDVPSIFYGSSIKKGSVALKYYITGTLIAECSDTKRNGELIEVSGSNIGSVVGVVMYDEGIMLLTASHSLGDNSNIQYGTGGGETNQWVYFGAGCNDGIYGDATNDHLASASFDISCKGTSYVNTMTLLCHANKNKLDYSNNPTFVDISGSGQLAYSFTTSSYSYSEEPLPLKNIVSSSFSHYSSSYEKTTYLSKIGIYDDQGNLIMIASMAKPVKKTIQDEYTFKLTLDI